MILSHTIPSPLESARMELENLEKIADPRGVAHMTAEDALLHLFSRNYDHAITAISTALSLNSLEAEDFKTLSRAKALIKRGRRNTWKRSVNS